MSRPWSRSLCGAAICSVAPSSTRRSLYWLFPPVPTIYVTVSLCHSMFSPHHFSTSPLSLAFLSFLKRFGFVTRDLKCVEIEDEHGE